MSEPAPSRAAPSGGEADRLFMEFLERWNGGERPSIEEFLRSHPDQAEELAMLFQYWQQEPPSAEGADSGSGLPGWLPSEFGRYRPLRLLGGGGYGFVCLAEQRSLKRLVALKILSRPSPRALERFRREAEILARLDDPRIVSVFENGQELGFWYTAMEFVPGISLEGLIERAKVRLAPKGRGRTSALELDVRELLPEFSLARKPHPIPYLEFAAGVMAEVCEALAHVHLRGVIHRDLKPANLILNGRGLPRVIDFGLAREGNDQSLSRQGEKLGTVLYMSPEQVTPEKKPLDHRTDLFSLGVVLYELFTLKHPFEADTSREIEQAILDSAPRPMRRIDRRIPRDLEAVVARALERDPDRRYANAGEMAADLGRVLRKEPVRARHLGPLVRAGRWTARRPKAAAAAALLTLLSGASLALVTLGEDYYVDRWNQRRLAEWAEKLENADPKKAQEELQGKNVEEILKGQFQGIGEEFLKGLLALKEQETDPVKKAEIQKKIDRYQKNREHGKAVEASGSRRGNRSLGGPSAVSGGKKPPGAPNTMSLVDYLRSQKALGKSPRPGPPATKEEAKPAEAGLKKNG